MSGATLTLMAALLWSSGGILIKAISLDPMTISAGRSVLGFVVFALFLKRIQLPKTIPEIGAALAYGATVTTFVVATKWTTAANAILLQYTAPVYVALFAPLYLGETRKRGDLIQVMITILGTALFFFDDLEWQSRVGNFIAVFSGISFGWFILFLRKQARSNPATSVLWGNVLAFVICAPFAKVTDISVTSGTLLVVLGVFQLAVPYLIYAKAITRIDAVDSSLILMIEPILNPVWVFIAMNERPSVFGLIGGGIVIAVVAFRTLRYRSAQKSSTKNLSKTHHNIVADNG